MTNINYLAKSAEVAQQSLITAAKNNKDEVKRLRRILRKLKNMACDASSVLQDDVPQDELNARMEALVKKLLDVKLNA